MSPLRWVVVIALGVFAAPVLAPIIIGGALFLLPLWPFWLLAKWLAPRRH